MLEMLIGGALSVDAFINKTDSYIEELSRQQEIKDDISHIMNNKLEAWCKIFKSPRAKDYKYLEKTFGFSKDDLFGNLANVTVKETTKDGTAKSAKELASFVKEYIKGQDEAIDKLAVQFFLHLDSKRKQYTSKIKCPSVTIGPTGSGKSAIFRTFAKFCDCPIIRINLSSIQPEGWRGNHITDYFAHEIRSGVSVKDSTGHDLLVYEESPLFRYFYRFLIPIEYNHPDYKECENSYWSILFQLLFAESENVKVIAGDNGLPKIEFDYCEDERRTVSSLTLDELRWITSELSVKALTNTLVDILGYEKQMDTDYANRLKTDQLILKEEFYALYNIDRPDASTEDIAIVEKLYARIKECDLQTFPYKF